MDIHNHKNIIEYINSNNILDTIQLNIDNFDFLESIKRDIIKNVLYMYKCIIEEKHNDIHMSIEYYTNLFVNDYIDDYVEKNKIYISRKKKVEKLKKLKLPEQRSVEWFSIRKKVLTASSLASALGKCHYTSRNELVLSKASIEEKPYVSNPITEWGVKYEEIATKFYEAIKQVKILEFGMIPHPQFPIFGASPDGICSEDSKPELIGRMLEIKCPPKRKFTKAVPQNYMYQMQGQLECCDLDECDFLQVKLEEYSSYETFSSDTNGKVGETKHDYPKGCVVTYKELFSDKLLYLYPDLYKSNEYYVEWEIKQKEWIETEKKDYYETKWWYIVRYECTLVKRDKIFWNNTMPEIIKFWEDVEYYKTNDKTPLLQSIEQKKYKKNVTFVDVKECMID
tara:strand:- start:672 stop:1859 length:1188 start_codon:yes stop_codon:yes gene_type:complete